MSDYRKIALNVYSESVEDMAKELAERGHSGQKRKFTDEPYIVHPKGVVELLKSWGVQKEEEIAVAYMHDLLEDTHITKRDIVKLFGSGVLKGVEDLSKDPNKSKQQWIDDLAEEAETYVIIIKVADRLSNTHDFIKSKQFEKAESYFHKADRLFDRLRKEKGKIVKNAIKSVEELEDIFNSRMAVATRIDELSYKIAKGRPETLFEQVFFDIREQAKKWKTEEGKKAVDKLQKALENDMKSKGYNADVSVKLGKFRGSEFVTSAIIEIHKEMSEGEVNKLESYLKSKYSPKYKFKGITDGKAKFNVR